MTGQKSSRMRDVGLGVEGERPRVSMGGSEYQIAEAGRYRQGLCVVIASWM
jgi:hypothetical protein